MPSVAVSPHTSAPMITFDPPRPPGTAGPALSRPALTRFLARARAAAQLSGEVDVLLAGDATLRRLNRTFRGRNKPTDVLSFPAADLGPDNASPIAGDLAISLDTAARQAVEHGHSLLDEIKILILHGVLHLAGYDHENDSGEMAALEAGLRARLRLPNGLIARSSAPAAPRRPNPDAPARPAAKAEKPRTRRSTR